MTSPFLGQILTSIIAGEPTSAKPASKISDAPLQPMQPGAWAAWARAARDDAAAMAAQPSASPARKARLFRFAPGLHR